MATKPTTNVLMLRKKRSLTAKKLTEARARAKKLRADEEELAKQLEAVQDEIPADLEQQIQEVTDAQTEVNDQIGELVDELSNLDDQLAAVEDTLDEPAPEADPEEDPTRSARKGGSRRAATPVPGRFACRSRCFASRSQRDAFYANPAVHGFLDRIRSIGTLAMASRRSVTGADLTIPDQILDVLRDNLNEYSKLISKVRLRQVRGQARQHIIGKVPEGIWMEMAGALNDLEFKITDIETDGYKVGGYIPIDNYLLKDSDIALGEEILYALGQAIGYALDKAIVYGLGPNSKMPVGIVTRLAQTAKPGYWTDTMGDWTDLHSSHILTLDLASKAGTDFFVPFLQAAAKAEPTYTTDGKIWICNDATRQDLLIRSLAYNSAAALMAGLDNTMPIVGGEIITLEFIPDHQVIGGYGGEYVLVEREGGTFASSDLPLFVQDKTVYKGTARYDGQPVSGEGFVAISYDNVAPTTSMAFAPNYAGTPLNALVVTSAKGGAADKTTLTVAGTKSTGNDLYAMVGAPVSVNSGDSVEAATNAGFVKFTSGGTIAAANGAGITVVEVDAKGKIISAGYVASAVSGA